MKKTVSFSIGAGKRGGLYPKKIMKMSGPALEALTASHDHHVKIVKK